MRGLTENLLKMILCELGGQVYHPILIVKF